MSKPHYKTRRISLTDAAATFATNEDADEEKLADYLDYLHVQKVKKDSQKRISLEQVRQELALS